MREDERVNRKQDPVYFYIFIYLYKYKNIYKYIYNVIHISFPIVSPASLHILQLAIPLFAVFAVSILHSSFFSIHSHFSLLYSLFLLSILYLTLHCFQISNSFETDTRIPFHCRFCTDLRSALKYYTKIIILSLRASSLSETRNSNISLLHAALRHPRIILSMRRAGEAVSTIISTTRQ